ncbi:MAG: GNAT family N-acetyltransferase [Cellvibrionaceae bacterium]
MPWNIEFTASIEHIGRENWASLCACDYPFLSYDFLAALETSGCTSARSGWQPHHAIIKDDNRIVGLMPLYQKTHSYGEYVFDWAWADAYFRHGLDYYPKLVTAIPFTPATGPRLCLAAGFDETTVLPILIKALREELAAIGGSSWHCLFPTKDQSNQLAKLGISQRLSCQFHWLNRGYQSFDDFLATFSSRKRKNLKKERRRIAEQGIELITKTGSDITSDEWRRFYYFYHFTYFKRSGRHGYLSEAFFLTLADTMPENVVMVIARQHNEMVAASLFFQDRDTLYGRYWGCSQEFEFLHFEACYYQGIEYAIEKGLQRFDPGAQGEHKIQRGFTPVPTWSNHWIAHPDFRSAIDNFLIQEAAGTAEYIEQAKTLLPFKSIFLATRD